VAYKVEFTEEAAEQVEALPKKIAGQIIRKVEALALEPRPTQAQRLTEHDHLYRVCSGDSRILYEVEDRKLCVLVVKVGNRRDVYRRIPPPTTM
jgi:mRNA interferase RelE/StbE